MDTAETEGRCASSRAGNLRWLYLVALTPTLTDLVERGALPGSPRGWITEVVIGLVLLALLHYAHRHYRAVLAVARYDPLTRLWNRRVFEEAIEDECARARRTRQPLSLVYLDLDGFKQINDRLGHHAGDRALKRTAQAIRSAIRARVDRGFRVGGDEFILLLPGSGTAQAERVVARIRRLCAQACGEAAPGPLVLSAGVVELDAHETAEELVRRADVAMYRQKRSGAGTPASAPDPTARAPRHQLAGQHRRGPREAA
jgi:diguanylate cyclase (GGDEF)-like protein